MSSHLAAGRGDTAGPRRPRLLWRIFAGWTLLLLLALAIVGVLVERRSESDAKAQFEQALLREARLVAGLLGDDLASGDAAAIDRRLRAVRGAINTRITVVALDGRVLADTDELPARMDNHGTRPEIVAARRTPHASSIRHSRTLGRRMMYVAILAEVSGRPTAVIRTSLPMTEIDTHSAHLRAIILAGGAIAAAVGLLLGYLVADRLARPLGAITAAAAAIAGGDRRRRVEVRGDGELGALATAFNAMTEQLDRRVETLAADRNKLAAILSGMVEGVVAIDAEERIVHINAVAGNMLRCEPGESIGRKLWEASRIREVTETLGEVIRTATDLARQVRLPEHPNDRFLALHASPLFEPQGGLTGAVVVLYDITQLRHLESVRQEFVANVSHELKTPVTAIRGLAETILDDPDMTAAVRTRFLERIRDQSHRLTSLVTDLLTLSRFESETDAIERARLDLRRPIQEAVRAAAAGAEPEGLRLDVRLGDDPLLIDGDAEALRVVSDNLLSNAIRYTPAGGVVSVRLTAAGGRAVIEIADTGPGIEPRHHQRIFERFYRVDKARSRELGGTGLGLSIVKHIVLAHGGRIDLRSSPGNGATFRVELPLADAAPPTTDPPPPLHTIFIPL